MMKKVISDILEAESDTTNGGTLRRRQEEDLTLPQAYAYVIASSFAEEIVNDDNDNNDNGGAIGVKAVVGVMSLPLLIALGLMF